MDINDFLDLEKRTICKLKGNIIVSNSKRINLYDLTKIMDNTFGNYNRTIYKLTWRIKNELNRTLTIMDDFMNYTKIKVNLDIIDINMLLNEVLESFSLIFKINNIDLINKVTDDEIYINGDYGRLKQVFINLIKNGIESFDGKKGKLEINTKENNKEVIISIIDNGCGMDEDILKNINEMFYTTKKNGTGIGLPLSNEIIKLHNGKLNFYSKKGKGTTVEIIFNKVDIN